MTDVPIIYSQTARNAEKAMTALARWRRLKEEEAKGPVQRRPGNPMDCTDVKNAERFRKEIIFDISKKIAMIQNPGLGEFKIRDLNDEINKIIKLKAIWDQRIKELGGPDYRKIAPKMLDREGREVAGGAHGYKYFGAAKELPGVRELFEQAAANEPPRKLRGDLMKYVDADYYGYMDDDDGLLIPLEMEEEKQARAAAIREWKEAKLAESSSATAGGDDDGATTTTTTKRPATTGSDDEDDEDNIYKGAGEGSDGEDDEATTTDKSVVIGEDGKPIYIRHVAVPSQKDIEQALLERRKAELMEKYVNEALEEQQRHAAVLMGFDQQKKQAEQLQQATTG